MAESFPESDSQNEAGGRIPGAPGIPAFALQAHEPSAIPVLIAVPHSGRAYPRALLREMRHAESVAVRLEDRYVDRLAHGVARETGASLLVANAPRAMIDLNRAPDDVDWEMIVKADRPEGAAALPSRRARSGLGVIPRRLPGTGELWRRRLQLADLKGRIEGVHEPYHAALAGALQKLHERWGAALLVDLHSMPPLQVRAGMAAPSVVVGDRFGATCHGSLIATTFSQLAESGRESAHNRPYAGGYVLERHADPRGGFHALQFEIDRSCYLDSALLEPGVGMASMIEDLSALVRRLAAVVSDLGQEAGSRGWSLAAE
ncbi:N-formylglutamate amidohydrolase [Novosphingobium mangrovi (ex Huang et al. 2023)]|uniref:N-formylglutamate amidohydrolase n=1 Tax=Novosphingobium mangrovi (ex Huang et al. 2023) TaxID=2976432 RepID=A0ABT2I763_9SPHN|nr:N-formylglutamate amidohydrolase [Novosphingobium mangrovi (ex Huang et al. 2023)]MCT2400655.1 N-formylglutamate amidohydrolase [Novosphingobium mangrovi (ex Huang et al. 2023)]